LRLDASVEQKAKKKTKDSKKKDGGLEKKVGRPPRQKKHSVGP
jgi:hypothetical protein